MKYRPLICGCSAEYQCSKCTKCYACKHLYTYRHSADKWYVKCPTGRIRPADPDIEAQERVLRERSMLDMGGDTYEKTTDNANNTETVTTETPAPAETSEPAVSEVVGT